MLLVMIMQVKLMIMQVKQQPQTQTQTSRYNLRITTRDVGPDFNKASPPKDNFKELKLNNPNKPNKDLDQPKHRKQPKDLLNKPQPETLMSLRNILCLTRMQGKYFPR